MYIANIHGMCPNYIANITWDPFGIVFWGPTYIVMGFVGGVFGIVVRPMYFAKHAWDRFRIDIEPLCDTNAHGICLIFCLGTPCVSLTYICGNLLRVFCLGPFFIAKHPLRFIA